MSDRILIIGLGSIGQRHARNALALGCDVIGCDPRIRDTIFRIGVMHSDGEGLTIYPIEIVQSLEVGLRCNPLGVIVATPPEMHYRMAMNFSRIPMLVEKPVTASAVDAEYLCNIFESLHKPLAVGYQFRHTAALRRLKVQADAGKFGTIYAVHAEFASQKWCSHRYPADLLLECSHELDLLRWMLGDPIKVIADLHCTWTPDGTQAKNLRLINAMQALFRYDEVRATLHLDGLHPGYRRSLTLYGTKGIGGWTLDQAENDQAYVDEFAEFLRVCRGEQAAPSCTGRDGWYAVRMVEAIRRSGESGKWEAV